MSKIILDVTAAAVSGETGKRKIVARADGFYEVDPAGTESPLSATAAVEAHEAETDPHPNYATPEEAAAAAPIQAITVTAPLTRSVGTSPDLGISAATTLAAGSMSALDKTKLDGVATGATTNATNAELRDRATHTGAQAISTVTGLQTAIDGKEAANVNIQAHIASAANPHAVTKAQTGLSEADNTSDANKPISIATQEALDLKASIIYVDAQIAALVDSSPGTLDTLNELAAALGDDPNFATTIAASIGGKEASITAGTMSQYWRGDKVWTDFATDARATTLTGLSTAAGTVVTSAHTILQAAGFLQNQVSANKATADTHIANVANPHGTTKAQVGLGSADDTSDVNKPVSTAQATAIALKADTTTVSAHTSDTSNPHGTTKAQVGLGSADNTSDASKPVSTATQTALDLKANLLSPTFTGVPLAPTAAPGTNTTQLSTTAFVQAAVAALVDSSPGTLDTLNELAAALGDDPNYATTTATAIGARALIGGSSSQAFATAALTVVSTVTISGTGAAFRGVELKEVGDVSTVYASSKFAASSGEYRRTSGFLGWGGYHTFWANGVEGALINSAGINGALGQTTPAAASVTSLNTNYTFTAETGAVNDATEKPGNLFYRNANSTPGAGAGLSFVRTWLNSYDVSVLVSGGGAALEAARFTPTGIQGALGQTTPAAASVTTLTTSATATVAGHLGVGTTNTNLNAWGRAVTLSAGVSGTALAGFELQGSRTIADAQFASIVGYHGANLVTQISSLRGSADDAGYIEIKVKATGVGLVTGVTVTPTGIQGALGQTTPAAASVTTLSVGSGAAGVVIRDFTGGGVFALYSTSVTPDTANYALAGTGTASYLNGTASANLNINGNVVVAATAAGVAVTGTLSASGRINGWSPDFQYEVWDGVGEAWYLRQYADVLTIHRNATGDVAAFSATGLAVTGTLSATGLDVAGLATTKALATDFVSNGGTTYTVLVSDHTIQQYTNNATFTLPDATAFPGRRLHITNLGAVSVVSATANVYPQSGGAAGSALLAATVGKWAILQSDGAGWYIVASN